VTHLVQLVFEYRELIARSNSEARPLAPKDRLRLAGLARLFGRDPDDISSSHRRRYTRCPLRLPATIKIGDRVEPVDIVDIGGGGVRVEPAPVLAPGQRALIRIMSLESGFLFTRAVTAGWSERTPLRSTMGLPFVGTPSQLTLAA